ncbi:MAG: ZinT/AdcA family metal-binding protein, partial [Firmicutes bacterium]|nr:ZinT/AdcA family metal-binding protein [Bacillota bacterium]
MFKKLLLMMLACLTALVFAGTGLAESDRPLQVVCTTFPQDEWARAILGEKDSGVELTLLLDSGVDLHSYQPTAADIARISTCDLFIYVGGESDEWVEDVLAAAQTPSLHALSLLSCVEAREEETVEGMQESDHHHDTAFTLEDIQNRTLEDFGGKWVSLWPMLKAGQLDAFLRHKAGESDDPAVTVDSVREKYIAVWACDAVAITVEGDTISFDDGDGQPLRVSEYAYAGYSANVRDDGEITVRYQFEAVSGDGPRYVQFNDHGHESGPAEHFHIYFGDDGFDAVTDESDLSDIQNLKSDVMPEQSGNTLKWTTDETDIYYQGKNSAQAPVGVSIEYTLDGKAVTADELKGQSGHLVATVKLTNNTGEEVTVNGKKRTVYTPFFTVAAAVLPSENFKNITTEHGLVESDSKTQVACYLAMPGMKEAVSDLLPDSFDKLDDLMLDTLTLEADVTDCTVPTFLFAAAPNLSDLDLDEVSDELGDTMDELTDAIDQLKDGSGALDDAVGT